MEKTVTKLENCEETVEIKVSAAEIQPFLEEAYLKAIPQISVKGFRKGKAPISYIKQTYGKNIEKDAEEEIMSKVFFKYADEEEVKIADSPVIMKSERTDYGLEFTVQYEVFPNITLGDYRGLTIDEPVHAVSDEEIEEFIKKLCLANGSFEEADQVADIQFVVGIKLSELDAQTRLPLIGKESKDVSIYLADETVLPDLRQSILNTKVGDSFPFLPGDHDEHAPKTLYNVTVMDIQKLIPCEFDDAFALKQSNGRFENAEDFRKDIGFKIQEDWDERSRQIMEDEITNQLVDMHDFPVPDSSVKRIMALMVDDMKKKYKDIPAAKDLTVDFMQNDLRPIAVRMVKWELIKEQIIKDEGIVVENYDIEPIAEAEAAQKNSDKNAIIKKLKENSNFIMQIQSKKVMDFILDFAITNEVSFDGYMSKNPNQFDNADYDDEEDYEIVEDQVHVHDHDHDHDHSHPHGNIIV